MQKSLGIYLHIPFCPARCNYCDFLTFPHAEAYHAPYLEALVREMDIPFVRDTLNERIADSIYVGGGTPSMMSADAIARLFDVLNERTTVSPEAEITLEANPGTFTTRDVSIWKKAGVNRVSLGVQTFSDALLSRIARMHTAEDARKAVQTLRDGGISNINIDLILALPEQTKDDIARDLEEIERIEPTHVSWYELILEEKTLLGYLVQRGEIALPSEETSVALFVQAAQGLQAMGFSRYEISNFARAGRESRHNLKYWTGKEYLGLGLGASGYVGGERHENTRKISYYMERVKRGEDPGEILPRTRADDLFEQVMMGFRKIRGIDRARFLEKNGVDVVDLAPETVAREVARGMMGVTAERVFMTEEGLWVQNDILSDLWLEWDARE